MLNKSDRLSDERMNQVKLPTRSTPQHHKTPTQSTHRTPFTINPSKKFPTQSTPQQISLRNQPLDTTQYTNSPRASHRATLNFSNPNPQPALSIISTPPTTLSLSHTHALIHLYSRTHSLTHSLTQTFDLAPAFDVGLFAESRGVDRGVRVRKGPAGHGTPPPSPKTLQNPPQRLHPNPKQLNLRGQHEHSPRRPLKSIRY